MTASRSSKICLAVLLLSLPFILLPKLSTFYVFAVYAKLRYGNHIEVSEYRLPLQFPCNVINGDAPDDYILLCSTFSINGITPRAKSVSSIWATKYRWSGPVSDSVLDRYGEFTKRMDKSATTREVMIAGIPSRCWQTMIPGEVAGSAVECLPRTREGIQVHFVGNQNALPGFYDFVSKIDKKENR